MPHALPTGLSVEGLGLRAPQGSPIVSFCLRDPLAGLSAMASLQPRSARPVDDSVAEPAFAENRIAFESLLKAMPDLPASLAGRVVHRRDRELVVEIALDRPVDWRPASVEVIWGDGTRLAATIEARRTTRHGRMAARMVVRLALRLDADGPPDAPAELVVTGRSAPLTVTLTPP
jgi:hypothetical protein